MCFDDCDFVLGIKDLLEDRIIFHVFKSKIKEVSEEVEKKPCFTKS